MALSLGVPSGPADRSSDPKMQAAQIEGARGVQSNHIAFLNIIGVRRCRGHDQGRRHGRTGQPATAEIGRKFTNRQMPW